MDELCNDFPDTSVLPPFELIANINPFIYSALYSKLFNKFNIDDAIHVDELYNLVQQFPVTYEDSYTDIFICNLFDFDSTPYIRIEEMRKGGASGIGYLPFSIMMYDYFETITLRLELHNLDHLSNTTISYHVIENKYTTFTKDFDVEEGECVSVDWGDWVDNNIVELHLTKIIEGLLSSFKLKIYMKEDPDICAYIG